MKCPALFITIFGLLLGSHRAVAELEPGLVGAYYPWRTELTNFPTIPPQLKPVVKTVTRTIHFELPNLPFYDSKFTTRFAVIWGGQLYIPSDGKYVFFLESDDGSRLFVDGSEVISNGETHGMIEKKSDLELTKGLHAIQLDYFQNRHGAGCHLAWQQPQGAKEIIPEKFFFHEPAAMEIQPPAGLKGEYFQWSTALREFPEIPPERTADFVHIDKAIDFELPNKPFPKPGWTKRFFVRWTGNLVVTEPGDYSLLLESDDGSRLFLDDSELINNGGVHGMATMEASKSLSAGEHKIRVEYFQNSFGAGCSLAWKTPSGKSEIVPPTALTPP